MPGIDEAPSRLEKVSTGLDHTEQMGINAVRNITVQDFDNEESDERTYHWGYMPFHFSYPNGWYVSTTHTAGRVSELTLLVVAIHRVGLEVIMDVVRSHTPEDRNECKVDARFSFNGLAPRYYYRTCDNIQLASRAESTFGIRQPL